MTDVVDKNYFHELAGQDPAETCKRAACDYDDVKKIYKLACWGNDYIIDPTDRNIECIGNLPPNTHEYFQVFIMHYLLMNEDIKVRDEWISEKDIPGGSAFFVASHKIPSEIVEKKYGNEVSEFKKRCEQLGGAPLDMADAAYCFEITPYVPVAVLYWMGDDEFPAQAKLLFDKSVCVFPLDVTFALALEICCRIGGRRDPYTPK